MVARSQQLPRRGVGGEQHEGPSCNHLQPRSEEQVRHPAAKDCTQPHTHEGNHHPCRVCQRVCDRADGWRVLPADFIYQRVTSALMQLQAHVHHTEEDRSEDWAFHQPVGNDCASLQQVACGNQSFVEFSDGKWSLICQDLSL
eukprot:COSAG06_NODE_1350_length_9768_cov_3.944151_5_plen_143_part_00